MDLEGEIREYLESHNVCTMAVTDGVRPYAHTMYYATDGLKVYLESESTSQKIHVINANPRIALTVDEDYGDWRQIKGVELSGKVKQVKEKRAPEVRKMFEKKFPQIKEFNGIPTHHVFLEVTPEKIYYLDFTQGFGTRKVYYAED